jgi:hypothetical protein
MSSGMRGGKLRACLTGGLLAAWLLGASPSHGGRPVAKPGETTMSEQNKQVALKFLEAMGSNDPVGAAETLAPGAMTNTMGTGSFAGSRSAEAVLGAIESFKALMPSGLRLTIKTVTAEGDRVVVEASGNAETRAGTRYANNYVFVITLKDGKITEINEYFCSIYAEKVLWPLAQGLAELAISRD